MHNVVGPRTIALDFDGTYTSDPELWDQWIRIATSRGHRVLCVTFRPTDKMEKVHATIGQVIGVENCICTNGKYKKEYTSDNNIQVDIWIDDIPETIVTSEDVQYWHEVIKF